MIDIPEKGKVYIVGAGPGDPELITLKGVRVLESADVTLYDRLVSPELLERTRQDTTRIFVGKRCGRATLTQVEINETMVRHARAGERVVRLKGGDPFVFGRGGEECQALVEAGIPYEVIPGITSVTAVPAYAGIPVTHRDVSSSFTVMSGHLHGSDDTYDWRALASASTLIVLMGLRNLDQIADRLIGAGKDQATPAAVIRWGTTEAQETVTGPLGTIAASAKGMEPPAVVVIGEVAAYHEELGWFGTELASSRAAVSR